MTTLSILITYHNEREMLTSCLESVRAQSVGVQEVLIYDDASEYPPEPYIPANFSCRVIRGEQNKGPAYGRNVLLAQATSEYVHFHDSDDWLHPDWSKSVQETLEQNTTDVVFTEISSVTNTIAAFNDRIQGLDKLAASGDLIRFCIFGFMLVPSGTYRRSLLISKCKYDEDIWQTEDYDFHLRLASLTPSFSIISVPLICIRRHPGNRSSNTTEILSWAILVATRAAHYLPDSVKDDLAERIASFASQLYQQGAQNQASRAFIQAKQVGTVRFRLQNKSYRIIARMFGPIFAEKIAHLYRRALPEHTRRAMAKFLLESEHDCAVS